MKNIGIVVGSLKKASFSRMVANYLANELKKSNKVTFIEIGDLPLYNEDIDTVNNEPASYKSFRKVLNEMDSFIIVSPEYNRGIPGGLKNALDVGSRPYGHSAWNGKKCAIVTQSPGLIGGFGAANQLRQVLAILNMPTLLVPEVYLSSVYLDFDKDGNLVDEKVKKILNDFVLSYNDFIK